MKLYVGNLSRDVNEGDLKEAFEAFGQVNQVTIVKDRSNTVSRGFGFVEMPVQEEAMSAIAGLHMRKMKGQSLDVIEAKPRLVRPGRGGSHSGGGGRHHRR
jgi:RNA recognition motif-containing protein